MKLSPELRNSLACVVIVAVFGAGCSSWKPPTRPIVSKSGQPYAFPQKYEFKGDLRVALADSSIVEVKDAYALDYTLHGTAEGGSVAIPFHDIVKVEEKNTPQHVDWKLAGVLAILIVGSLVLAGFSVGS